MKGIKERAIAIMYKENLKMCSEDVAKYWAEQEYLKLEPTAFMIAADVLDIDGKPTNEVYKNYRIWCFNNGHDPISQCAFSRRLQNYFGFGIIDKRLKTLNGKKCRVFKLFKIVEED